MTKWKTAGDSLLAARRLARPDSKVILLVGAGTVSASLRAAYATAFPEARFTVWNRTPERAEALAAGDERMTPVTDLACAVAEADVIATATMAREPVIKGEWLRPGQHLNMIGAFKSDMREADDTALLRGRIFVDSHHTAVDDIGELNDPITRGVLSRDAIVADYYDLAAFEAGPEDITVFKNGGGAHMDLMTARYILERWQSG